MFHSEINQIAGSKQGNRSSRNTRLNAGLAFLGADDETPWVRGPKVETFDPLLAHWDLSRLHPSSCNLRSVVLMSEGVATGETGLAQECRPANG